MSQKPEVKIIPGFSETIVDDYYFVEKFLRKMDLLKFVKEEYPSLHDEVKLGFSKSDAESYHEFRLFDRRLDDGKEVLMIEYIFGPAFKDCEFQAIMYAFPHRVVIDPVVLY